MVRGRIYDPGACIGKGGHIEGCIGGRGRIYDPGVIPRDYPGPIYVVPTQHTANILSAQDEFALWEERNEKKPDWVIALNSDFLYCSKNIIATATTLS